MTDRQSRRIRYLALELASEVSAAAIPQLRVLMAGENGKQALVIVATDETAIGELNDHTDSLIEAGVCQSETLFPRIS